MGNHQTTGSITLDIDAIAAAVIREIRPLIQHEMLSELDMADVLRDHLGVVNASSLATQVAAAIVDAGYRLVRVREKTSEQRAEDWFAPGRRD